MKPVDALLTPERLADGGSAPLYLRLQRLLGEAIERGALGAGDALPPERELARSLGISRVTVRKALAELVDSGRLQARRGSGTFVAGSRRFEQPLSRLISFTDDVRARGLVPSTQTLDAAVALPSPEETMVLGLAIGQRVARLDRLRLADGKPMAIERAVLPTAILPDPAAVTSSLYALLEARGLRPARGLQRLAAANLTAAEAGLLQVATGAAVLRIDRVSYLGDGRVVEFTRSLYRGDTYDFVAELVG